MYRAASTQERYQTHESARKLTEVLSQRARSSEGDGGGWLVVSKRCAASAQPTLLATRYSSVLSVLLCVLCVAGLHLVRAELSFELVSVDRLLPTTMWATSLPSAARHPWLMKKDLPPIHNIRRQRVMLDSDLARLYGVTTSRFNEAVKRNIDRFPVDFRFQLTREEHFSLISQSATSKTENNDYQSNTSDALHTPTGSRRGGLRKLPWGFTEHGALMAATVLNSPRAVQMSLFVVRAFVQMREALMAHAIVIKRLAEIDKKLVTHDVILRDVYEKLRPLLNPPTLPRKEVGFHTSLKNSNT